MKPTSLRLSLAAICCMLSAPVFAQTPATSQQTSNPARTQQEEPTSIAPGAEADVPHLVKARAMLVRTLDAAKDTSGSMFEAKLSNKLLLDNGIEIPKGSTLIGQVVDDDMNAGGNSKLALRFTKIQLKDGSTVPVQATIVGMYPPALDTEMVPDDIGSEWKPNILVMDQVGVLKGVDLHSRIGGRNSGTFVSSTKSEVKLGAGSQFALAIGPVQPATTQATLPGAR